MQASQAPLGLMLLEEGVNRLSDQSTLAAAAAQGQGLQSLPFRLRKVDLGALHRTGIRLVYTSYSAESAAHPAQRTPWPSPSGMRSVVSRPAASKQGVRKRLRQGACAALEADLGLRVILWGSRRGASRPRARPPPSARYVWRASGGVMHVSDEVAVPAGKGNASSAWHSSARPLHRFAVTHQGFVRGQQAEVLLQGLGYQQAVEWIAMDQG